jgi:SNF2 family DNA or RNA helicase
MAKGKIKMSIFKEKQIVSLKSNPNKQFPIFEIFPMPHGETRYKVFVDNAFAIYYQSQLMAVENNAETRLTLTANALKAKITALQLQTPSNSRIYSLNSGRIQFVPYQYRPVLKLIRADRPRLLIADEVGVGKTIESGLIIKELKARMDINSVLIICPKALVAEQKWHKEMKRFDEDFRALDGERLRHCLKETDLEGQWPRKDNYSILPFSLFDSELVEGKIGKHAYKGLSTLDTPPKFDLIIVDEAHHLRNSETWLHKGVSLLCEQAQAVVFLTATPIQLGQADLYTLLNLLRPDLIIDGESFKAMTAPNPHLNTAIYHCRKKSEDWQYQATEALQNAANGTEWGLRFLRNDPDFKVIQSALKETNLTEIERVKLIRNIESFYTFNDLINRTRRRDIGNFTQRKPQTVEVDFTASQRQLHNSLLDVMAGIYAHCHGEKSVNFMLTTIRRQAASCLHGLAPLLKDMLENKLNVLQFSELSDDEESNYVELPENLKNDIYSVIALAEQLPDDDPKIEQLLLLIADKQHQANNKILLFSSFRHTLRYLVGSLPPNSVRFGLIHGEVSHEERADLRRRFSLPRENEEAIDLLLSSEVGCEGLDFQFCDYLVNYDLPWNPMRIEQRIGRIDRYGQKSETVAIVNFIVSDTVDADIYHRCLWRIGVFESAIGGCEAVLGDITQQIHSISEQFTLTDSDRQERLQQIADNDIRILHEQEELESRESELFGIDIAQASWNDTLKQATSPFLSAEALQGLVSHYLQQRLEKEQSFILGDKPIKTLRLSHEARQLLLQDLKKLGRSREIVAKEWEFWLKGNEPTLAISFSQEGAAENNHVTHIDTLHPLIRLATQAVATEEQAFASVIAQSADIDAGLYPFAIYRWDSKGVKADQEFVAVTENTVLREQLMTLLASSESGTTDLPEQSVFDDLEQHHYQLWQQTQAEHQAKNRQRVEHRLQSLRSSHAARVAVLQDIIRRSTSPKIKTMKESQLHNADADFQQRVKQLEVDLNSGDILAQAVLFGMLEIRN